MAKVRYIMDALDQLNADWALRKDKDHPLQRPMPGQGIHDSRRHPLRVMQRLAPDNDIQSLPHEQDENQIPTSVKRESQTI